MVRAASSALGRPVAASFKHVSPAGVAAGPLDALTARIYHLDATATGDLASAYVRARDADPKSSYGDFIAVSEPVDAELADLLRQVRHLAEPGGSLRSADVAGECRERGIAPTRTGIRLFQH